MFDSHDIKRDAYMLEGPLKRKGYDWWWHSFTAINEETGEEKPFFIEFFMINPSLGKKYPIYGQLPANKEAGKKPSYMMIKAGCWGEDHVQLHRFYGTKSVIMYPNVPFSIQAGKCYLSENETRGSIKISKSAAMTHPEWMCDYGEMKWDLKIDKQIPYNVGFGASTPFRKIQAFEMYWHAEGMKTKYEGSVELNGVKYKVIPDKSYGYADKNWGRNFTSPWVWLASNNLYSLVYRKRLTNSAFDIGGGKPKVYFVPLEKKLLGGLYYEGKQYDFNFSKIWTGPGMRFKSMETDDEVRWKVWMENTKALIKVDIKCKKKDMILVNYESPDGQKKHDRLWNGGNGTGIIRLYHKKAGKLMLVDVIEAKNIGCEFGEYSE